MISNGDFARSTKKAICIRSSPYPIPQRQPNARFALTPGDLEPAFATLLNLLQRGKHGAVSVFALLRKIMLFLKQAIVKFTMPLTACIQRSFFSQTMPKKGDTHGRRTARSGAPDPPEDPLERRPPETAKDATVTIKKEMKMIHVGEKAPDFVAPGYQKGKVRSMSSSRIIWENGCCSAFTPAISPLYEPLKFRRSPKLIPSSRSWVWNCFP